MNMPHTPGEPPMLSAEAILVIRQNVIALMEAKVATLPAGQCYLDALESGLVLMAQAPWVGTEVMEALTTLGIPRLEHETDLHHLKRAAKLRAKYIVLLAERISQGR